MSTLIRSTNPNRSGLNDPRSTGSSPSHRPVDTLALRGTLSPWRRSVPAPYRASSV